MARRRRSSPSTLLIVLFLLVTLPLVALLVVFVVVDPNDFKPQIADAVMAATGRKLSINGRIAIGFSLSPTLEANDVHLSNPPGYSRPDMATLDQVKARLALRPLLHGRIEIARLELNEPDLLFETDALGQSNWHFTPPSKKTPDSAAAPTATSSVTSSRPSFAVGDILIHAGKLTWQNNSTGHSGVAVIKQLAATSKGPDTPMSANADIDVGGHAVSVTAETGPLAQLLGGDVGGGGWPLQLVVRVAGARLATSGTIEQPMDGRGYQMTLDAAVPDLGPLGAFLGENLPALRDVSATAKISDAGGVPTVSSLMVRVGASDLKDVSPGLMLESLEIAAPGLDQPITAKVDGSLSGAKLHVDANFGALSLLLPGTTAKGVTGAAFPIDINVLAAGATISAKGALATPLQFSGLDLAISARVPDLAALSPLAKTGLPALHDVAFDGRLTDAAGGLQTGLTLKGIKLSGPIGDLAGDITLALQPRLALQAQLAGKRLDLDALQTAITAIPAPPKDTAKEAPPANAPPVHTVSTGPDRLIPDHPFNLAALRRADADVQLTMGEIHSGGANYRDLVLHLVVDHGKLSLEPFTATLPGGHLDLHLTYDTGTDAAPLTFSIAAPGVALKPLLTAFEFPDDVSGIVELDADVTASGQSAHALAASLSGKIGLIMTDGVLDNRLLSGLLNGTAKVARMPADLVISGGQTKLRCGAVRLDANNGGAAVNAFVLDTSRALIQGGGSINLRDETVAMRLRPLLRVGGPGLVVPIKVTGRLESPDVAVDSGGAIEGVAGSVVSGVTGAPGTIAGFARNPLGTLTNALVGERGGDACGPAIALARGARPVVK